MTTKHETLTPDTAAEVTFSADHGRVAVLVVAGTAPVYFRADAAVAAVAADGTYAVLAGARRVIDVETDGPTSVSVISAEAADVEIEAL